MMNREEALKIIYDLFIKPKLDYYSSEEIQLQTGSNYNEQMRNNIRIMEELQKYLKENLK